MYNQIHRKNQMRTKHQKADYLTVKMTATTLILAEGVTTTLEVKNKLRKQGYLAFQHDISEQMLEISLRENWIHYDNGLFRIYTFPQIGILPQ